MHNLLGSDAPPYPAVGCQVVTAAQVSEIRASDPDLAIVALVDASDPAQAVQARLDGADVVLPVNGEPDPGTLSAAIRAAEALARRAAAGRAEAASSSHALGGAFASVAMVADLLTCAPEATERRADQFRALAQEGGTLAWRAGRASRSGAGPLPLVDVGRAIRQLCGQEARTGQPLPKLGAGVDEPAAVLVDRSRFVAALAQLVDNARRAGSGAVEIDVESTDETVSVVVSDDGPGLPEGWGLDEAVAPFRSGWPERRDGLGLTEVAELAVDGGGSLAFRASLPGERCRVVLSLPSATRSVPIDRRPLEPEPLWAQAEIMEGVARRALLEDSLEKIVATMEGQLPGSLCSILLLDQEEGTLSHGAGRRLPETYRKAIDGVRIGERSGSCGAAAHTGQPAIAVDVTTDWRWVDYRHVALEHGLRSCWSTPIVDADGGAVLGTFAVYHAYPWTPDVSAVELVGRFTHIAAVAIGTDRLYRRLVESESRFRSAFEDAGVGMALVGLDGALLQVNTALSDMLAVEGPNFLWDLLDGDNAAAIAGAMRAAIDGLPDDATIGPEEIELLPSGRSDALLVSMTGPLVTGADLAPRYFCIEMLDLTERRLGAQARLERDVAQAATRAKSDFLALVSHELRTPLNAVIGFAQVMQLVDLPPERRRQSIEHILAAGGHLLQLINDLLDLSAAETGALVLDIGPVSARAVIGEALEIVDGLAAERQIVLHQVTGPDREVLADPQRLRQVLLNLLGNAVKYTPAGGTVSVRFDASTGRISVEDSGSGIAPEDLPLLFTPFHRIGGKLQEGSGPGLAVSAQLVEAMGGQLQAHSELGVGSTFWVELMVGDALGRPASNGQPAPPAVSALAGTILYVEDDAASVCLVETALAGWPDVQLLVATTRSEGERILRSQPVDLLLLDIGLAGESGWDLISAIGAASGVVLPPTIVLSAGVLEVPPDAQIRKVLAKPFVLADLLDDMARALAVS